MTIRRLRKDYTFKIGNIVHKGGTTFEIDEKLYLSHKQLFEDLDYIESIKTGKLQTGAVHEGDITDRSMHSPDLRGKREKKKNESGKSK